MAIKHDWYPDGNGGIDVFRMAEGYCNGPECMRCGESFCHHCYPACYDEVCSEQTEYLF